MNIKNITSLYRRKLHGIKIMQYAYDISPETSEDKLSHIVSMLNHIDEFTDDDQTDKAFRWLGFVQGVLWTEGIYTLNEMKDHNV